MSPTRAKVRRQHLYQQVAAQLTTAIESGEFASGRLPTESELTRQFDVSLVTVRKALAELTDQDLIMRRQGSGTYIKRARPPVLMSTRRRTHLFCYVSGAGYEQFPGNFPNRLMVACQHEGETRAYDPILVRAKEGEVPAPVQRNKVDGVLIACTCIPEGAPDRGAATVAEGNERYVRAIADQGYPVVAICNYTSCPSVHCVLPGYERGTEAALQHLAELGHKRIALIGGPFDSLGFVERLTSAQEIGASLGLEVGEPWIAAFKDGAWRSPDLAREEIRGLLQIKPRPTAALVISGPPLLSLETIRSQGIRVPEDMSVITYSNNPQPKPGDPPHIDPDERTTLEMALIVSTVEPLAAAGMERLLQRIQGRAFDPSERVIRVPVQYVPGATVAPAPAQRT